MTTKTKTKDIGWMYYTANKREDRPPASYPPASQIPGLSAEGPEPPQEQHRIWIKDTDSPYIKLAKQGGRQNLLAFRENVPSTETKDYPRCEWFYHEDVHDDDDAQTRAPYVFKLPEYMVHHEPSPLSSPEIFPGRYPHGRVPYATDKISAYERDRKCTDKTIAIPNDKRSGYGVRQEKQKNGPPQKFAAPPSKPKTKGSAGPNLGRDDDPTQMHKLMGGTYEREWHQRRKEWEAGQPPKAPVVDKLSSEYREAYHKAMAEKANDTAAERAARFRRDSDDDPRERRKINREIEKMEKEVFKLSRFKNVNAKVDSNRQLSAPHRTLYEPSQSDAPRREQLVT